MKTLHLKTAHDDAVAQKTQLHVSQTALQTEEDPTIQNAPVPVGLDDALSAPDTGPAVNNLDASGQDENSAAFLKHAGGDAAANPK